MPTLVPSHVNNFYYPVSLFPKIPSTYPSFFPRLPFFAAIFLFFTLYLLFAATAAACAAVPSDSAAGTASTTAAIPVQSDEYSGEIGIDISITKRV